MKAICGGKIDPSIKGALEKLVNIDLDFYVVGGLLCQYYLKDHVRYTKDVDIVFNFDHKIMEEELRKTFGEIDFYYNNETDSFYEPSFTCFTKIEGLRGQIEGKKISFFSEIKTEQYSYEGIAFKGVRIEYVIAEKIISLLNELPRPYKHLVDIYSFSQIDQSLIDKDEIKRYVSLINAQENRFRKTVNIKEHSLPKQIPTNKVFTPPFALPMFQGKYNMPRETMVMEVNKWLKSIL